MMTHTGFERLRTSLEHKEPDRVPCDFGAAEVEGINIHTMKQMRAHLGLSPDVEMDNRDYWRRAPEHRASPRKPSEGCFLICTAKRAPTHDGVAHIDAWIATVLGGR
jgi:hypothetical protein